MLACAPEGALGGGRCTYAHRSTVFNTKQRSAQVGATLHNEERRLTQRESNAGQNVTFESKCWYVAKSFLSLHLIGKITHTNIQLA